MAMDSTFTMSPPTSRASAARSCVAVITLIFEAAWLAPAATVKSRTPSACIRLGILTGTIPPLLRTAAGAVRVTKLVSLKWMRSMGAHRKHELEQDLVGGEPFPVSRPPELSPNLAELARPVCEEQRAAGVAGQ